MRNNRQPRSNVGGVIVLVLLSILLIGLKLTGVISWHWLWVLAPIWISFLVMMIIVIIAIIFIAMDKK